MFSFFMKFFYFYVLKCEDSVSGVTLEDLSSGLLFRVGHIAFVRFLGCYESLG